MKRKSNFENFAFAFAKKKKYEPEKEQLNEDEFSLSPKEKFEKFIRNSKEKRLFENKIAF